MTEAERITRASKSNLALAFVALSKERQRDISVFYAFCRIVDDIADEPGVPAEKAAALDTWRRAVEAPVPGESPLAPEVRAIIAKYALQPAHFQEVIAGVEMDLHGARYATWDDLRLYCHRVASVVGLVSLPIFGLPAPEGRDYALNLGLALQLTNIMRDVGQDYANEKRIYLPQEELSRFGVTEEDIAEKRHTESFRALMAFQCTRARGLYTAAIAARPPAPRGVLTAPEIMRGVYTRLLDQIEADQFHVLDKRHRVGKLRKLAIILRTWLTI